MTVPIHMKISPAKEREDTQEKFIEPFCLEYGRVAELVMRGSEKGSDNAVQNESQAKAPPQLLRKTIVRNKACSCPNHKMPDRLKQPL